MDRLEYVHPTCLRLARVRLDCVAMLLFRKFWETLEYNAVDIHIFADGSPQWRGLELFASSADIWINCNTFMRKLLPCVSLPRWMADAMSKTIAFLWQVYLMVGPAYAHVRHFCNRVRSFTTDMGVERLMSNQRDCLIEFYEVWLGVRFFAGDWREPGLLGLSVFGGSVIIDLWGTVVLCIIFNKMHYSCFKPVSQT